MPVWLGVKCVGYVKTSDVRPVLVRQLHPIVADYLSSQAINDAEYKPVPA